MRKSILPAVSLSAILVHPALAQEHQQILQGGSAASGTYSSISIKSSVDQQHYVLELSPDYDTKNEYLSLLLSCTPPKRARKTII